MSDSSDIKIVRAIYRRHVESATAKELATARRLINQHGLTAEKADWIMRCVEGKPIWVQAIVTVAKFEEHFEKIRTLAAAEPRAPTPEPYRPSQNQGRDIDGWLAGVTIRDPNVRAQVEQQVARWAGGIEAARGAGYRGSAVARKVLTDAGVLTGKGGMFDRVIENLEGAARSAGAESRPQVFDSVETPDMPDLGDEPVLDEDVPFAGLFDQPEGGEQ